MDESQKLLAASFGAAALEYERGRPGYPDEAVDWMIPAGAMDAIDVGAGTGKFTRQLIAHGLAVTAVDPSPQMLDQLRAASPGVTALQATAESIPLPASSADVVTSAQAWHWVDGKLGFPEVARVLRPGGSLSLIWNFRDNGQGWMKQLAEIISDRQESVELEKIHAAHPMFGEFEYRVFPWSQTVTRDDLLDLVRSRSVFIVASEKEQHRVIDAVTELLGTHPEVAALDEYELPYRTHTYRGRVNK